MAMREFNSFIRSTDDKFDGNSEGDNGGGFCRITTGAESTMDGGTIGRKAWICSGVIIWEVEGEVADEDVAPSSEAGGWLLIAVPGENSGAGDGNIGDAVDCGSKLLQPTANSKPHSSGKPKALARIRPNKSLRFTAF